MELSSLQQRTAQQKTVTYGYAKEYVVVIAGHIRRSEKYRIYGKGAEATSEGILLYSASESGVSTTGVENMEL